MQHAEHCIVCRTNVYFFRNVHTSRGYAAASTATASCTPRRCARPHAHGTLNAPARSPAGRCPQNVGNFITDKPSSRVLAPPGGQSTISFGNYQEPAAMHRMPSAGRRSGSGRNGAGQQPGPVLGGPGMPPFPHAAMPDWQRPPLHQAGRPPLPPSGYGHADAGAYAGAPMEHSRGNNNNYARPGGQQNVGNFITDKPSSRVLAPPGGKSTISFGNYQEPAGGANRGPSPRAGRRSASPNQPGGAGYGAMPGMPPHHQAAPLQQPGMLDWQAAPPAHSYNTYGAQMQAMPSKAASMEFSRGNDNNYARPGGQQNVGNFITDRPSSRVLAPPGGKSQISFG
eukprot:359472-Chlamydomonas_euryale.AAC.8